ADAVSDSTHGRRLQNFGIKTLLSRKVLLPAHLNNEMLDFRKAIKQHGEHDFSDETRTAEKKNGVPAERVDRRDLAASLGRRRLAFDVFALDRIPAPLRAKFHQTAFAVLRNGSLQEPFRSSTTCHPRLRAMK